MGADVHITILDDTITREDWINWNLSHIGTKFDPTWPVFEKLDAKYNERMKAEDIQYYSDIATPEEITELNEAISARDALHAEADKDWQERFTRFSKLPAIHVQEVSTLKASLFGDEKFVSTTCDKLYDIFDDNDEAVEITDKVIAAVDEALALPNDSYYDDISDEKKENIKAFVREHKGQKAFIINW
jgi:hypothetical protein